MTVAQYMDVLVPAFISKTFHASNLWGPSSVTACVAAVAQVDVLKADAQSERLRSAADALSASARAQEAELAQVRRTSLMNVSRTVAQPCCALPHVKNRNTTPTS